MLKHPPSAYIPVEPEENGVIAPLILSALVHVIIVAFIFYTHHIPDIEVPESIETSMITQAELAQIQGQIQANRTAQLESEQRQAEEATANAPSFNSEDYDFNFDELVDEHYSEPKPIPERTASPRQNVVNDDTESARLIRPMAQDGTNPDFEGLSIREQDALYREQIEQMASEIDADIQAEQQDLLANPTLTDAQKTALIEDMRIKQQEQQANVQLTLPNGRRVQVDINPAAQGSQITRGDSNRTNAGRDNVLTSPIANNIPDSGINKAAIQAQLKQLIYSRWSPPIGSTGKQITALVTVDTRNGRVTEVNIIGADSDALENSLRDAIQAGPLTPVIGTNLSRLRIEFNVR